MAIDIPNGRPIRRFMRYVRPPIKESDAPLFPLRPATRPLRLGIDTATLPAPPGGYLTGFHTRDEIEVNLLVQAGETVPAAWTNLLQAPIVREIGFSSVAEASRWLDTVQFFVSTTYSEDEWSRTTASFFDIYQQLDEQAVPPNAPPLSLGERHRAAAYAILGTTSPPHTTDTTHQSNATLKGSS